MINEEEIIQLIIKAQNLDDKVIQESAEDVEKLGEASSEAERKLQKLKIAQATLKSFQELGERVRGLKSDLATTEVEYEKLNAALKKNKNATDEERKAVKLASLELKEKKFNLAAAQREYKKLRNSVKDYGANTRNLADVQKKFNSEIEETNKEVKQLNSTYRKQASVLKEQVASSRAVEKSFSSTSARVREYQKQLEKLHATYQRGRIGRNSYIKAEERLRKNLKLTEAQVKKTRGALDSVTFASGKQTAATDNLAAAARKLTAVYLALQTAQQAAQSLGETVKDYNELESAMTKVQKTTNLAREEIFTIAEEIQRLASDVTPTATNELLNYAEVAGQLGVTGTENILRMAAAADALNVSTNLAGDEAVTLLTRILSMTGEGTKNINNLASSVVDLGNNFAVAEDEIAHMTKEVVTGAAAIELSSHAAAAFGTVLKESGQQAERSRSAMFKLSQSIKEAALKGGEDLERLAYITGLTADEIEKNLGERPEEVLLAFFQGLNRAKGEGQLLSDVLRGMGITGVEAVSVIEILADKSNRLQQALTLSNAAWEDGNKHIKEAAQAYANQESQIGRLKNQFTELSASIGAAYSDETNEIIQAISDSIDENSEAIIGLMQNLADVGGGIYEIIELLSDVGSMFGSFDLLSDSLLRAKQLVNGLTGGIRLLAVGILEIRIRFQEWKDELGLLSEEGVKSLEKLRKQQEKFSAGIAEDIEDIREATRRLNNESSADYEDLRKAASKYQGAVSALSQTQQEQIKNALEINGYQEESNKLYRQLTEAITRKNREVEIEVELLRIKQERQKAADAEEEASKKKQIELQKKVNEVLQIAAKHNNTLATQVDALNFNREKGIITAAEYKDKLAVLAEAEKQLAEKTKITRVETQLTNDQYADSQGIILNLVSAKRKLENTLTDLNQKLKSLNKESLEYKQTQLQIKKTTEELARAKKDLQTAEELESKTLRELVIIQRQHQVQMEAIENQYRAGNLTKAEYSKAVADNELKTRLLNDAVGKNSELFKDNTDDIEQNTDALQRNADVTGEGADKRKGLKKPTEELSTAVSLWAMAEQQLNAELDFTGEKSEDLKKRIKELNTEIRFVRTSVGGWWDDIIQLNNQAKKREQQIIRETLNLRKWTEQVESGRLSLSELDKMAQRADTNFRHLSGNQLEPLRSAIREARREFQSLTDAINDSFVDVEDRLDALLGKEEDIMRRRFEREMKELLDLLKQAELSGDRELINKINEAIRKLKQAQRLELNEAFGKDSNRNVNSGNQNNANQFGETKNYNVNVTLPDGSISTVSTASEASAQTLMEILASFGEINAGGVQ